LQSKAESRESVCDVLNHLSAWGDLYLEHCEPMLRSGYDGYLMIEGFGYSADQPGSPGYLLADTTVSPEEIAVAGASYLKGLLRL
jgi:hypothetical protein